MRKISAFLLAALFAGMLFTAGKGNMFASPEEEMREEEMQEETDDEERVDMEDYRRYLEEEMHNKNNAGEHEILPDDTGEKKNVYPDERYKDDGG